MRVIIDKQIKKTSGLLIQGLFFIIKINDFIVYIRIINFVNNFIRKFYNVNNGQIYCTLIYLMVENIFLL